jgi:hypothetical protein
MIRKDGSGYSVYSEKGKRLSKPMSKEGAKHRLSQIEFFKNAKKGFNQDVGFQDVSASSKTLQVDSQKADQANRINNDAYKAFLKKAADDPSYTAEIRDGIADYDRYEITRKQELEKLKKKDHFHKLDKSVPYGHWLKG